MKDEVDEKAREILCIAIQRCAADHAAEATVSAGIENVRFLVENADRLYEIFADETVDRMF